MVLDSRMRAWNGWSRRYIVCGKHGDALTPTGMSVNDMV